MMMLMLINAMPIMVIVVLIMRNMLCQAANVEKAVEQLKSEGLDVDGMVDNLSSLNTLSLLY